MPQYVKGKTYEVIGPAGGRSQLKFVGKAADLDGWGDVFMFRERDADSTEDDDEKELLVGDVVEFKMKGERKIRTGTVKKINKRAQTVSIKTGTSAVVVPFDQLVSVME
jgi:hypothetical protein